MTSTQTPAEIDTKLAELYVAESNADRSIANAHDSIRRAASDRKDYNGRWSMALARAITTAQEIAATDRQAANALTRLAEAIAARDAIRAEAALLNAEFTARGGWTRAFMVSDGHVHRSMNCSTCNNGRHATQFSWMTDYSGKDEAEIVDAAGWRACTVCYPSAPVGVTHTRMFSQDEIAKAAARAEREAKAAAKAAKAIANAPTANGQPLTIRGGIFGRETFKTERSAIQWATDQYWYEHTLEAAQEAILTIATAVAEKRGVAVEVVLAEIDKKGNKKRSGL